MLVIFNKGQDGDNISTSPIILIPPILGYSRVLALAKLLGMTYPERPILSIDQKFSIDYSMLEAFVEDFVKKLTSIFQVTHFVLLGEGILLFAVTKKLLEKGKIPILSAIVDTQIVHNNKNDDEIDQQIQEKYEEMSKSKFKPEKNSLLINWPRKKIIKAFELLEGKLIDVPKEKKEELKIARHNFILNNQYKLTGAISEISVFFSKEKSNLKEIEWRNYAYKEKFRSIPVNEGLSKFLKLFCRELTLAELNFIFLFNGSKILLETISLLETRASFLFSEDKKDLELKDKLEQSLLQIGSELRTVRQMRIELLNKDSLEKTETQSLTAVFK